MHKSYNLFSSHNKRKPFIRTVKLKSIIIYSSNLYKLILILFIFDIKLINRSIKTEVKKRILQQSSRAHSLFISLLFQQKPQSKAVSLLGLLHTSMAFLTDHMFVDTAVSSSVHGCCNVEMRVPSQETTSTAPFHCDLQTFHQHGIQQCHVSIIIQPVVGS